MRKQQRTTLILVVLLLIIVGVYGVTQYSGKKEQQEQQTQKDFLANFDVNNVSQVELQSQKAAIQLQKENNAWVIASEEARPAADSDAIQRLVAAADNTLIQSIVATVGDTPAGELEKYGLDDAAKTHVVLRVEGGNSVEFEVGKYGSLSQTFYARRAGENTVYLVSGSPSLFTTTDWKKPEEATQQTGESNVETDNAIPVQ